MDDNNSITQCADSLGNLCCKSPEQLSVAAEVLALLVSRGKSADDLNVIGNFIVGVGSLLLTMAAQKSACESRQDKQKQIADLKRQLKDLESSC